MENVVCVEETFELPEDFEFSSHCGGGKFGSFAKEEPETYVIQFSGQGKEFVKECIWSSDQVLTAIDEDTTEIRFTSSQFLKVKEWILSQGRYAKPIAPEWFVEGWKNEIKLMMQNISK